MSSKKNKNKQAFAALISPAEVARPAVNVNPLSAELPHGADPQSAYDEDAAQEEAELEAAAEGGSEFGELVKETLASAPNPSEFDPDSDPKYDPDKDFGTADLSPVAPVLQPSDEEVRAILEATPKTGITPLGHPAEPEFNPRDPSKGFYQGIDPQTGKRIYSER